MLKERVILGIDPGTVSMGYGIIQTDDRSMQAIKYGVLNLAAYTNHALKLQQIFMHTLQLIDEFNPDEAALEAPFYGKNVQSMLKLGRAQGIAMAAALSRKIIIAEYAPRKVKQAVTGNGNASKEQVARMLMHLLSFTTVPEELDATDALAVAVCHVYQSQSNTAQRNTTNWKQMLQANPDRLYHSSLPK